MSSPEFGASVPPVSSNKPWWSAIHESRPTYRASIENEPCEPEDLFDAYFEDEDFNDQGLDPNEIKTWILEAKQKASEGAGKKEKVYQRSSSAVSEAKLDELPVPKNKPLELDKCFPHGGASRADSLSYDELISESIPHSGSEIGAAQMLKQPALVDKMIDSQSSNIEVDEQVTTLKDLPTDGQRHNFDTSVLDGVLVSPLVYATTSNERRKIEMRLSQMLETPVSPLFRDQHGRPYGIEILMHLYLKGEYSHANLKYESLECKLNEVRLSSTNVLASTSLLLEESVVGTKDPGKRNPSPREDWYRMKAGLSLVDESPEDLVHDSQIDYKGGSSKAGIIPLTPHETKSPASTRKLCISEPTGVQKDMDRGTSTDIQKKRALSPRLPIPLAQRSPSYPKPAGLRLQTMHSATRRPSRSNIGRARASASLSHSSLMRPISPATLVFRPSSQLQSQCTPENQTYVRDEGSSLQAPAKDFLSEYVSFDTKIADSQDMHPALRANDQSLDIKQPLCSSDNASENPEKESRRSHVSRSTVSLESPIPHWHGHQRVPSAYLHSPSQSPASTFYDHVTDFGHSAPFPAPVTPIQVEPSKSLQTPVLCAASRSDTGGYKHTEDCIRKVQSEAPLRNSSDSVQSASSFGNSTPITPFSRYYISPRSEKGMEPSSIHAYNFQKPPSYDNSFQATGETCPFFQTAMKIESCSDYLLPSKSVPGLKYPLLSPSLSGKSFTQRPNKIRTRANVSETSATDLLHPQVFASSESSETFGDNQDKDTCSQIGNLFDKEAPIPEEPILPRRIYLGCENASSSTCFINRKDGHAMTHDDQRSSIYSTTIRANGENIGLGIATNCPNQVQNAPWTTRTPERTMFRRTARENENQFPAETSAQGTCSPSPSNALSSQKLARLLGREALSAPSVGSLPKESAHERRKQMVEDWLVEESAGGMKKVVQRSRKVPPPSFD
ncbi:MAG: hypothetical protein Q9167_007146 [Letrouitia subvulpina]